MELSNLRWADEAHTGILGDDAGGRQVVIPADPANADFVLLTEGRAAQSDPLLPAVPPAVIADPE